MSAEVLHNPTLILNRNWQPVRIATVERAMVLLCRGVARAIDPTDYRVYEWDEWADIPPGPDDAFVSTISTRIRAPEVVALTRYTGTPYDRVTFSRRNVFRRDRYRCQYCGARPGTEDLTIDHVLPRSQGGVSSWENCVLACLPCNNSNGNRTPAQAGLTLATPPIRPSWSSLYAAGAKRIDSWSRFVSEKYWTTPLRE